MPWAAVIPIVAGVISAVSSNNSANKASQNQLTASNNQAQVAQNQLDFGKQQYADWQGNFDPGLKQMGSLAMQQVRPDYGAINSDVGLALDSSQNINQRTLERYGATPADGNFNASQTQYGLARAMDQVNADNTARMQAKDQQFKNLASFEQIGAGQQAQANSVVNSGSNALGSAYGNQANMYGNQVNQYTNAAAAGANMAGRAFSGANAYSGASGSGSAFPLFGGV